MTSKPSLPLLCCLLFLGCVSPPSPPPAWSWAETKVAKASPDRRFPEHAGPLQSINSGDRDYGASIEQWRARVVCQSIGNPFFWTSLAAFVVSALALAAVVHQRNQRERQEMIAAELLAQYHNAWVHASRQAREAIARHNSLVETSNRASQASELLPVGVAPTKPEWEREPASSPTSIFLKGNLRPRTGGSAPAEPGPGPKPRNLRRAESDLLAQLQALQDQLAAACERERNLERQLNRAPRAESSA